MENRLDELLDQLKRVNPPDELNERVLGAVRRDARARRTVTGLLYIALLLMAPGMFVSARLLVTDLSESPFGSLLKLAVTDWSAIRYSLADWLMALFEALPVASLALTLGALFFVMALVNHIVRRGLAGNRFMKEAI